MDMCNEDWFEGTIKGKQGFFPANHIRLIAEDYGNTSPRSVDSAPGLLPTQVNVRPYLYKISSPQSESPAFSNPGVGGSPWTIVSTEGGQRYFWNESTNETSWEQPPDFYAPQSESSAPIDADRSRKVYSRV